MEDEVREICRCAKDAVHEEVLGVRATTAKWRCVL